MILIRPATREDAEYVGAHLRPEDEVEVRTASGDDPGAAVVHSWELSQPHRFAVWEVWDGRANYLCGPIGMFGATPASTGGAEGDVGVVWFLGTPESARQSLSIIREAPEWLDYLGRIFEGGLVSYADQRNTLHIAWCRAVGFQFDPEMDTTINGFPFTFIYRTSCVTPQPSLQEPA